MIVLAIVAVGMGGGKGELAGADEQLALAVGVLGRRFAQWGKLLRTASP